GPGVWAMPTPVGPCRPRSTAMVEPGSGSMSVLSASARARPGQQRLRGGALGLLDIASSTMADIGPAMSFTFGFGYLASTAGVAAPLTIAAAGVVVALLGNT